MEMRTSKGLCEGHSLVMCTTCFGLHCPSLMTEGHFPSSIIRKASFTWEFHLLLLRKRRKIRAIFLHLLFLQALFTQNSQYARAAFFGGGMLCPPSIVNVTVQGLVYCCQNSSCQSVRELLSAQGFSGQSTLKGLNRALQPSIPVLMS